MSEYGVQPVGLDAFLQRADIVRCTHPASGAHLMKAADLRK
jgi:hypothetical protein